ncbi:hypothetical protein [Dictyobacter arantiisoli]|uniref:DUF5666 domain-containing protein n=1 Tax=Dictyobacter arantiisoli TaxID=2014874 RepID=A0A5A5TCL8_9CHLR|nr:hypothetical protein [Dictyobacter arantiisoli]GCF08759.1 hypothetical protein KDI_23230 [Dictyobacter arantiisoli]
MFIKRFHKLCAGGAVGILLLAVLSGCNAGASQDNSTGGTAASAVTATATCTPVTSTITRASGMVKSVTSSSLVITKQGGSTVTASLSSKTTYTQEALVTKSALTNGVAVSVTVTQNADGSSYTADSIQLSTGAGFGGGRAGGFGGRAAGGGNYPGAGGAGSARCGFPRRSGTPGTNGGFGGGANGGASRGNANRLIGTVSQVSGDILTVTDFSSNDYSLTLTSKTQITQTKTVTASALKAGQNITLLGTAVSGNNGAITARSVSITLAPASTISSATPA